MILIDNTQIVLAAIFSQQNEEFSLDVARHIVLNCFRNYRSKYHAKFGELVICRDSGNLWRKEVFPHYKCSRKKTRKNDGKDWESIFNVLHVVEQEIRTIFPYKSIAVDHCEADDVIATLTKNFHDKENIMIISSDKDFKQLYRYPNVTQFSPIHGKIVVCEEPERYLFEHIVSGDSSDSIPNILSEDDTFAVEGKRQKPLTVKKLASWQQFDDVPQQYRDNIIRNQKLVDLTYIPIEYETQILEEYSKEPIGKRSMIFDYMIENKMKLLIDHIQDF